MYSWIVGFSLATWRTAIKRRRFFLVVSSFACHVSRKRRNAQMQVDQIGCGLEKQYHRVRVGS